MIRVTVDRRELAPYAHDRAPESERRHEFDDREGWRLSLDAAPGWLTMRRMHMNSRTVLETWAVPVARVRSYSVKLDPEREADLVRLADGAAP